MRRSRIDLIIYLLRSYLVSVDTPAAASARSLPIEMFRSHLAKMSLARLLSRRSDEITKRVLSLEFARGREKTKQLEDKAIAFVQRHRFDNESPEAQSRSRCMV